MSKRDPFRDPEWKRFEKHVRNDLIPKLRDSAATLVIAPDMTTTSFDVQFAVQIGASILLEKPLLVIAPGGRTLPPKLERIADRIIRVESTDDPGVAQEIAKFFADFGKQ